MDAETFAASVTPCSCNVKVTVTGYESGTLGVGRGVGLLVLLLGGSTVGRFVGWPVGDRDG